MNIGLCTISNGETKVETILAQAADAGYDGIEIWGKEHVDESPQLVRRTADIENLEIPVYGSYLRPGTPSFNSRYKQELEVAAELGTDLIRVWAGNQEYNGHDSAHWEAVVADLKKLTSTASDQDIGVTIEKHEGTLTNNLDGARRLLTEINESNCGLNWQPLFGMDADAILNEAQNLAPLSNNIHIQAVSNQGQTTRCGLVDAFFDIEGIIKAFQTSGFDGYINVEFVRSNIGYTKAIKADLQYLRSIGV